MPARKRRTNPNVFTPHGIVREQLSGAAAIEQMADDFRCMVVRTGSVTEDDMALAGWTRAQVSALGDKARSRAIADARE